MVFPDKPSAASVMRRKKKKLLAEHASGLKAMRT